MNNKGDIPSIIYVVIAIFAVGVLFFFMNNITNKIYSGYEDFLESNPDYNDTEAHTIITDIKEADNDVWDYAFLFIVIGMFMALMFTAFSTRISAIFFWVYVFLSILILFLGVMFSNIWQKMAANPEMATTLTRFPITNTILGTYYPTLVTTVIMVVMILLFGKFPSAERGYGA